MNLKHNALEGVKTSSTLYGQAQQEVERSRVRLVDHIKIAREAGATQQAISDSCNLSRQRIAQILNEEK